MAQQSLFLCHADERLVCTVLVCWPILRVYNYNVQRYHVVCVCAIVVSDVTSQGTWTLLNEFEDPELKSLASRLPHTILYSRADSTVKKYVGAFKR